METSLGFKIVLLDEALYTLKKFCSPPSLKKVPSRLELALAIEKELPQIPELADFLSKGAKNGRRHTHLAKTLSHLFFKYGRFSPECLSGWQKELAERVYKNNSWITPHEFFSSPLLPPSRPMQVDLFALSFLTELEFQFLKRLPGFPRQPLDPIPLPPFLVRSGFRKGKNKTDS